jgi:hypothetical protein
MRIAGRRRITEAELWDCDALNLVATAFIEFAEDGSSGSFGFIAVQGEMDCREVDRDGRPGVEFSWEGMPKTPNGLVDLPPILPGWGPRRARPPTSPADSSAIRYRDLIT